jgi:hypothetical protein
MSRPGISVCLIVCMLAAVVAREARIDSAGSGDATTLFLPTPRGTVSESARPSGPTIEPSLQRGGGAGMLLPYPWEIITTLEWYDAPPPFPLLSGRILVSLRSSSDF